MTYEHVVTGQDIMDFQKLVRRVPVSEPVMRYAVNLARSHAPGEGEVPDFINKWLDYGASVRASQYLILGGKARALMNGRYHVSYRRHTCAGTPGVSAPYLDELPCRIGANHRRTRSSSSCWKPCRCRSR